MKTGKELLADQRQLREQALEKTLQVIWDKSYALSSMHKFGTAKQINILGLIIYIS